MSKSTLIPTKLKTLISSKSLIDFSIVCQGEEFRTYKFLLAMHSDVFAAMFEHQGTAENKSGKVVIDDVDPEVMRIFLSFLGGEEIGADVLSLHAMGLFKVADKYNVDELRKISQAKIIGGIKRENCAGVIQLAYLHDDKAMMSAAARLVRKDKGAFLGSEEWKQFKEISPQVALQALEDIVTSEPEVTSGSHSRYVIRKKI